VNILLDTHVLLWWLADDPALPAAARGTIADGANRVVVSAATAWEISIKQALGKLDVPSELEEALDAGGIAALPITVAHALAAGSLPRHHDDPFDRMLIAQAGLEGLTLLTFDENFTPYGVPVLPRA